MTSVSTPAASAAGAVGNYSGLVVGIAELLESARRVSARAVNAVMTATYWEIGRRIVEFEQGGRSRAEYGDELLKRLAADLTAKAGRGFAWRNIYQMRAFFQAYPRILQTVSAKSNEQKFQTLSAKSDVATLAARFPLPWSHYVRLLSVENPLARSFYEAEALRGGWSVRQLDRQISTLFYERTALSRDKAAMLKKGGRAKAQDTRHTRGRNQGPGSARIPGTEGRILRVTTRRGAHSASGVISARTRR